MQAETANDKFMKKYYERKDVSFYGAELVPDIGNGNVTEPFDWNKWLRKTKNESGKS